MGKCGESKDPKIDPTDPCVPSQAAQAPGGG